MLFRSGVGGGFAGGGEGGCAGGEIVFYDAGVVCRRGDAWGDVELKQGRDSEGTAGQGDFARLG